MILGSGDIATVLPKDPRLLFFASGVSNSQEVQKDEFLREKRLLLTQEPRQHIVYFSSLGVFNVNTPYMEHKREMESFVKAIFSRYTIVRIGNITWGHNSHTFINAFLRKPYEIKDEYRYMVEKEEFLYWINLIPTDFSCEMNIPGKRMKVIDALKEYGHA